MSSSVESVEWFGGVFLGREVDPDFLGRTRGVGSSVGAFGVALVGALQGSRSRLVQAVIQVPSPTCAGENRAIPECLCSWLYQFT